VVSRGEGHNASTSLFCIELRQCIECAAKLKGARALQVLALQEHFGAEHFVHRARGHHGSAMGVTLDSLRRCDDIVESGGAAWLPGPSDAGALIGRTGSLAKQVGYRQVLQGDPGHVEDRDVDRFPRCPGFPSD
jgi:hypothetical protein